MNAPVRYNESFCSKATATALFTKLSTELAWVRRPDAPRSEYWTNDLGRPYTYGRGAGLRTYEAQPAHDVIDAVRKALTVVHSVYYQGCFLNMYHETKDWLGWHSDDDPGIDHSKPIAVVTLYREPPPPVKLRQLDFRAVDAAPFDIASQKLEHGSLLLMNAGMQSTHQHRVPKAGFNDPIPRISLTFRALL